MELHRVDSVDRDIIAAITRDLFGIAPMQSRYLGSGSSNVAYLVTVADGGRYVIRFNRGFRDDVYDGEVENYQRVHAVTGVRVPEVTAIDRSRRFVPTSYMVLEYLEGIEAMKLWHDSASAQRRHIRAELGQFYAALHAETRSVIDGTQADLLLLGLSQYAEAVEKGFLDVDLAGVARCEQVIRGDAAAYPSKLSLCMGDGEIYFARRNGRYELAFVCDLEWMGFGNRLADLAQHITPGIGLLEHNEPIHAEPGQLRADPFFIAYEESAAIDYSALGRVALYTQLSTWGLVAGEPAEPAKKQWIREHKSEVIGALIQRIAAAR